ncbi:MAG: TSUP family transporter [Burkholderiales bacterium]
MSMAAGAAGLVDAIVGGGGLILVPALFTTYPSVAPATLFGTNKAAAIWGTAWAASQYVRRVQLNWRSLVPAALAALLGAWSGALSVIHLPAQELRRGLPLVLLLVLVYTLVHKDLGRVHAPRHSLRRETGVAVVIGSLVGFYDGLFGPGTGSFFVFLLVRWLGYDFLHASAAAKLLNTTTNLAALALFVTTGHILWTLAASMAVANVMGSMVGARLALRHGAGFVRAAFILVVGALILRTGYDIWWR